MSDTLDRILEAKRAHVAAAKAVRPRASLEAELGNDEPRDFEGALAEDIEDNGLALIAEIKKASPSKGLIRADFDPPALARAYAEGGATCLSVLTDKAYFRGSDEHLRAARAAVALPCLRKDFTLEPYQVIEARTLGADCILVIMAALTDAQPRALAEAATGLGMDVLAEVHDEAELERALRLDVRLIGINNRDLKSLTVDLETTERLAPRVPADRLLIAESGLYGHDDLRRLAAAGARCFLVGESLMRHADVAAATRALLRLVEATP